MAVLLLILATGFFVAVEFALVAVDRERVEVDAAGGSRRARHTADALRRLSFHLSGAQLGITVTSLVVGFIAEPTVADVLEPALGPLVGDDRSGGVSIVVALVLATLVSMIVGELVPKTLAIARPRAVAYALAGPMVLICRILGPLISFLNGSANRTVRLFGIEPQEELTSVRSLEELELLIRSSGEEGTLEPKALTLLTRSIRFGTKDAAAALIPRRSVQAIGTDDTVADLAARAVATGHSRFPVIGIDLDDVHGVVHVKDVYGVPYDRRPATAVREIMASAFVVPETRELDQLLADLRRVGSHLAVVVDEHGGTAGIITLEDILEEIVGEIDDEHDPAVPRLTGVLRPGEWRLDGSLHPDEVYDASGLTVPEGDYETLAGFVLHRLGRIPEVGEGFEHDGWQLEVTERDGLRVAGVVLRRSRAGDQPPVGPPP
ncbi:MAG: hemolysin family protein [Acidimicrobiales bacterium]|nr:hemolysin family protein [Acidimicrobiales bacterium]